MVKIFMRRVTIGVLLFVVIFMILNVWDVYEKDRESLSLRNDAQSQLADLSTQQNELNTRIADLESNRGKEAALRDQYSVGSPGEHEIVIEEPSAPAPQQATTTPLRAWLQAAFSWW